MERKQCSQYRKPDKGQGEEQFLCLVRNIDLGDLQDIKGQCTTIGI